MKTISDGFSSQIKGCCSAYGEAITARMKSVKQ